MSLATIDVTLALEWLCTFAMHSTLLLAAALLVGQLLHKRALAFQEGFLRLSMWAALVSSSLQYFVLGSALPLSLALTARASADDASAVSSALDAAAMPALELLPTPESTFDLASLPWPAIVAASVGASACFGLAWLWLVHRGLARVLATRQPEVDPRVLATAAEVARELGLRQSPHVSRCDLIATPIAFGWMRPEICLPARAAGLGDASLRAMLAHEITHLRQRDPAWMWLAAWLQALFPWQILLLLVRRRWSRLVELRCDATAARYSSPTAVARCLLDVADWLRPDAATSLVALGMAARPSSLRERVEAVLRGQPARAPRPVAFAAFGSLSLGALTLAAPGVQAVAPHLPAPMSAREPISRDDVPFAHPAAGADATTAALELLQSEHANLTVEVARLRADLRVRPQPPEITQMLSALERRMRALERLRARLVARVDRRSTQPR